MSYINLATIAPANSDLLDFADAVNMLDKAGMLESTIVKARTVKPARKALTPAKPAVKAATIVKPVKSADWRENKPSQAQLARMNRLEVALNTHYGENLPLAVIGDFANAGELSDDYRALAEVGKRHGLKWSK